jgi:hypothetical protein
MMINRPNNDPLAGIGGANINLDDRDDNSVSFSQIVPLHLPTQDSSSDESDDTDVDEPAKQTPASRAKTPKPKFSKTKAPQD